MSFMTVMTKAGEVWVLSLSKGPEQIGLVAKFESIVMADDYVRWLNRDEKDEPQSAPVTSRELARLRPVVPPVSHEAVSRETVPTQHKEPAWLAQPPVAPVPAPAPVPPAAARAETPDEDRPMSVDNDGLSLNPETRGFITRLLKEHNLPLLGDEVDVLTVLVSGADQHGCISVSQRSVASVLQVPLKRVQDAFGILVKDGVVSMSRPQLGAAPASYQVLPTLLRPAVPA